MNILNWFKKKTNNTDTTKVSLNALYWKIQNMMDEAGIGNENLHVDVKLICYSHHKLGTFSKATKNPEIYITVHMAGHLVAHDVKNPDIAIEKVKSKLLELKATHSIEEVTVDINNEQI